MAPTLTIYIPTARPTVARLLDSLKEQLSPEVELVVSDNTGNALPAVVGIGGVDYQQRRFNIGGDANILLGAVSGTAPWVWVIGDDDVLVPGAVGGVLGALAAHDPDRLICWDDAAPVPCKGFVGPLGELLTRLRPEPSLLRAATLITANVWRRDCLDVKLGLRQLDTRYSLPWAGIGASRYVVADSPAFICGTEPSYDPINPYLGREWQDYLDGLCAQVGAAPIPLADAVAWEFQSARRKAMA